jgi:RNA polymerase sigma factor (sigma-70 family)
MDLAGAIASLGPVDGDEATKRLRNEAAIVVFEKLTELAPKVFAGGWARSLGEHGWDDAVQKVFVKLMRVGPAEPPTNPDAYLARCIRNMLSDEVRRQKREAEGLVRLEKEQAKRAPAGANIPTPEVTVTKADRERFDQLVAARQAKSPAATIASTVALVRRITAGEITFRQACAEAGLTESALYKRLSNAKKKLRKDIMAIQPERERAPLLMLLGELSLMGS